MDKLQARYYAAWKSNPDDWHKIHAKLTVLDDVLRELRSMGNTQGMDNASERT